MAPAHRANLSQRSGAPWGSPTAEACCRYARARSGCSAWSGRQCMRSERPRASLTSVPAHDPRSIPQRRHAHRARPAAGRAPPTRATHGSNTVRGPRSAPSASATDPGGRSGRLARVRQRARRGRAAGWFAPKNHPKLLFSPPNTHPDAKKIIQNFLPPPFTPAEPSARLLPAVTSTYYSRAAHSVRTPASAWL